MDTPPDLNKLRESSQDDLIFGIGLLEDNIPYIHLFCENWSREVLTLVRSLILLEGLRMQVKRLPDHHFSLYMATCVKVRVEAKTDGHTSILQCPAWDATLEPIEPDAFFMFEAGRIKLGTYSLLFQAPEWEFLCTRDRKSPLMEAEDVSQRTRPLPPDEIRNVS